MTTQIVLNDNFDEALLTEIGNLRLLRILLAEHQLANLDDTILEMVSRGLLARSKIHSARGSLENELKEKISTLRGRDTDDRVIYADELEFFTNLVQG